MVVNNVVMFQKKNLIKTIRLRERALLGVSYISVYVPTDGQTGVTLNAVAIVMAEHKKRKKKDGQNLTANPNDSPSRTWP